MKTNGQLLREEFNELQIKDKELRLTIGMNIATLVISNGGSLNKAIAIDDGPTRISSWDDEIDEVVVGVTATHIIIDEAGNESAVKFGDISTETLVDTLCALEVQINDNQIVIEDYSDEVK
jgi:uncharacterized protein (UPF0218 family)